MENVLADPAHNDPTLDQMRATLAAELPHHAGFDGWTPLALEAAAAEIGRAHV